MAVNLILVVQAAAPATDVGIAVNRLTDFLLKYLTPLIAVGAFSMAFVELWKKLLDSRTKFQARRWVSWMKHNAQAGELDRMGEQALTQLLQLSTGVSAKEGDACARELLRRGGLPKGYRPTRKPAHSAARPGGASP